MTERGLKYLTDILQAICLIEEFIRDNDDFNEYLRDFKTQSAVERQLSIIGEALNQLKKIEQEVFIQHDQKIISFRNRLVHAYDSIDNNIVWAILKNHLPLLKTEIDGLLQ
jgi:uncharacterized protein with HEPN domain